METKHLARCIRTLESSLEMLNRSKLGSVDYEVFRNATVKGFELTLELSGKLLRKALRSYLAAPHEADKLTYKDALREAAKHGLIDIEAIERWFAYRDNRNTTAHDYGEALAEELLAILPDFIQDARALEDSLSHAPGNSDKT